MAMFDMFESMSSLNKEEVGRGTLAPEFRGLPYQFTYSEQTVCYLLTVYQPFVWRLRYLTMVDAITY